MKARKPATFVMTLLLSFVMFFGMPLAALAEEPPENIDSLNLNISGDDNPTNDDTNTNNDDTNTNNDDANTNNDDTNTNNDDTNTNNDDANTNNDDTNTNNDDANTNNDDTTTNNDDNNINDDNNQNDNNPDDNNQGNDTPAPSNSEPGKKEVDPKNIDAEKYSTKEADEGYDTLLCWAATAANMLWTAEYAQEAINPLTNKTFQNEDEVFDYFRKCFTDEAGVPDGAITYFTNGTYEYTGEKGLSQIREDAPEGELLPKSIGPDTLKVEECEDENILTAIGDMVDKAAGALLKWWNGIKFGDSAHWLTVQSLEWDDKGYTGIWFADSDNNPATDAGLVGSTPEEKAALAKGMPNSYDYYPLSLETIDGVKLWKVVGFPTEDNTEAIITFICTLDKYGKFVPVDPETIIVPESSNNATPYYEEPRTEETPQSTEQVPALSEFEQSVKRAVAISGDHEAVIKLAKEIMLNNGRKMLSLTNGVFKRDTDTEFRLYVLNSATMLNNVYLDGQRIGLDQYTIVNNPNGTFEIVLGSELLKALEAGSHSFKMELTGDQIDTFIVIQ